MKRSAIRQSTPGTREKTRLKNLAHFSKNTSQNSTSHISLSNLTWQIVLVQSAESHKNKNIEPKQKVDCRLGDLVQNKNKNKTRCTKTNTKITLTTHTYQCCS